MKHIFLILLLFFSVNTFAATVRNIKVDEQDRIYIVVSPENYTKEVKERPVIVLFHPIGYSAMEFIEKCDIQDICDRNDAFAVFPEALDEDDDEIITALSTLRSYGKLPAGVNDEYVWSAGVRIEIDDLKEMVGTFGSILINAQMPNSVAKGYVQLNEDKDDVKFINMMLDEMKSVYNISDDIYVAGASMGGAMAYKYAFSENNKAKKVGVIHGFIGRNVDSSKPLNKPICIFNTQTDNVAPFEGGIFNNAITDDLNVIAVNNKCTGADISELPNTANDGITITKLSYTCDSSKIVWFYMVDNADHFDLLKSPANDIDYMEELEYFFFSLPTTSDTKDVNNPSNITLYPSPATNYLYCQEEGEYEIRNLLGSILLSGENKGSINIAHLPCGEYIFTLQTETKYKRTIFIKK